MDRSQWKQERRLWNEVRMDTLDARQYDEKWGGYINPTHTTGGTISEPLHTSRDAFSTQPVEPENTGLFC